MDPQILEQQVEQAVMVRVASLLQGMTDKVAYIAAKSAQAEVDRQFRIYAMGAAGVALAGYLVWRVASR